MQHMRVNEIRKFQEQRLWDLFSALPIAEDPPADGWRAGARPHAGGYNIYKRNKSTPFSDPFTWILLLVEHHVAERQRACNNANARKETRFPLAYG